MKRILSAVAVAAMLFGARAAVAGPVTLATPVQGNLDVSVNVVPACSLTVTNFFIGNYDLTSATPLTNTHDIQVLCSQGGYNLRLLGYAGFMTDASSNTINYSLTKPDNTPWANNDVYGFTATGVTQTFTFSASVPANQNVPQGTYTDTITMSLEL